MSDARLLRGAALSLALLFGLAPSRAAAQPKELPARWPRASPRFRCRPRRRQSPPGRPCELRSPSPRQSGARWRRAQQQGRARERGSAARRGPHPAGPRELAARAARQRHVHATRRRPRVRRARHPRGEPALRKPPARGSARRTGRMGSERARERGGQRGEALDRRRAQASRGARRTRLPLRDRAAPRPRGARRCTWRAPTRTSRSRA